MKDLMTTMTISISDVMETMFYMPVEPRETTAFSTVSDLVTDSVKGCCLTFSGPVSGRMLLAVPMSLLSVMAQNFMGEDPGRLTSEHHTGTLKEALNMVVGNALSKADPDVSFDLGLPELIDLPGGYDLDSFLTIETENGFMAAAVMLDD